MRRLAAALAGIAALLLAGPPLLAPAIPAADAHAELVSSVPGAGQSVVEAPAELVLVFSERLDPLGTGVDLLDGEGRAIVRSGGMRDEDDLRILRVELPALGDGLYSVAWRSLSADDGHSAQGFFTFAVGDAEVPPAGGPAGGDVHRGHGLVQSILETLARGMGEIGAMLAFGLVIVALAVIRPLDTAAARVVGSWAALALVAAALGASLLIPLAAGWASLEPLRYATATQPGILLVARAAVGFILGGAVFMLAGRRPRAALAASGLGGTLLIVLLVASGHASAFASLVPVLTVSVHVAAAGCWLAGVLALAWLAVGERGRRRALLAPAVPRFSALALVSVGLFSLTGAYAWWLMTGQLIDLETPYGSLLALKVVVALGALGLGGLNYVGWRPEGSIGTARRLLPEAALGLVVVGVTALVASGSPPGPLRPVPIAAASSTAPLRLEASLALLPARPGANRLHVTLAETGTPATHGDHHQTLVELVLQRLDQAGQSRVVLRPVPGQPSGTTFTTDVLTPSNSRWDASVRLTSDGDELGRSRFVFAFDEEGLSEGRAMPAVDPLAIIALLLGGGAVVGAVFALAGGVPPRTHPAVARRALLIGAVTAGALAIAVLVAALTV